MGEPSKSFVSTLIPLSETVAWRIHNVSELLKHSAFSAMSLQLEVGWGPTGLSKWEISLHSTSNMLLARGKLLTVTPSPTDGSCPKLTHHLTIWIKRNGSYSQVQYEKDFHQTKEVCIGLGSTSWKIIPLEDLADSECGIRNIDEDCIDLVLKLTVFGQDLSQQ